jgi:predicted dehydrogenase
LQRVKKKYPEIRVYREWRKLVREERPDFALVMLENARTHPVVEGLAKAGVHIMSEKPMAARLWQADAMIRSAKRHGVKLMINWPTAWNPALHEARRLVQAGTIGQVYTAKTRGGHNGPKEIGCDPYFYKWLYNRTLNGAGALADYSGYGASQFRFVLDRQPVAVSCVARHLTKKYSVPDDNAVLTLEYPKALGVIEATWSQVAAPAFPYLAFYGTKGALGVVGSDVMVYSPGKAPRVVKPRPLPAHLRTGPAYLAWAIRNRKPIEGPTSPAISRQAQEVIEAAIRSNAAARRIRLPL